MLTYTSMFNIYKALTQYAVLFLTLSTILFSSLNLTDSSILQMKKWKLTNLSKVKELAKRMSWEKSVFTPGFLWGGGVTCFQHLICLPLPTPEFPMYTNYPYYTRETLGLVLQFRLPVTILHLLKYSFITAVNPALQLGQFLK